MTQTSKKISLCSLKQLERESQCVTNLNSLKLQLISIAKMQQQGFEQPIKNTN